MAQIGGTGGGGGIGWLRLADILPQGGGVVDQKVFDASGEFLESCRVSSLALTFVLKSAYPHIVIESTEEELTAAADGGHFEGSVDHTVSAEGNLTIRSETPSGGNGADGAVAIDLAEPPVLTALSFTGGYPGAQTELKAGDTFQITGTANKTIDAIEIQNLEAGTSQVIVLGAPGLSFTETITVADRGDAVQALPAHVRARDASTGAYGAYRATNELGGSVDGTDLVYLCDLYPTCSLGAITYPGAQQALKDTEQATVGITVADYDTLVVDSPNGDLTIVVDTPPTLTVQRLAGDYNVSTNNLRATATRTANGAVTVDQDVVQIAHATAIATVSFSGARIRSGVAPGNDTIVTLSFDQQMAAAPTMDPAVSRGTFTGVFSGGPSSWTNTLRVPDSENPANGSSNAWQNLAATNLAGRVTSVVTTGATYVIGGFTSRTLNFAAFTANSTETFPLTDESKLDAGSFSNGNPAVVQPFGTADTTDVGKEGWCAPTAASGVAVQMHMLHSLMVAANSGGLTLTLVQETA